MGRMAFGPTCGHRSVDQGYTYRFTALNPLRSSLSDSRLPSVPVSVNQAYRNGSHALLPATRANPQGGRYSVACRSVGQATDRDGTVYTRPNTERIARKPRRQQGRGPKDRRSPADTAHTVVVEDLNTKAGTASVKGTGAEPGRNLKQQAGRHHSLPARGGHSPERKPAPKAGVPVTVNPAPTSQTCSRCGPVHRTYRPSQTLICVWPAGSRPMPATVGGDLDFGAGGALRGGPFRGAGQGLPHGQGASPWGSPRPVNRMGWKFHRACVTLNYYVWW